jgi:hypothetical protein
MPITTKIKLSKEEKIEWACAVAIFTIELGLGIWLGKHKILLGDAMSRTANAFYVLFSRPYRLTSMGLVWNPLPSVLQLPFVWLSKWNRNIVTSGFSMSCVTAVFASWSVKALLGTFRKLHVNRMTSYIITFLYALNPYVLFYGANGMSENMMSAAGIQILCSLSLWMRKGGASHLIAMAFSFVIMFLVRYEAVPFAIFVAIGMAIHMLVSPREKKYYSAHKLEPLWYIEGSFWITFLPIIYTVLVWILYNWSITGNPLYFMNSGYSMSAYSAYYSDYGGMAGAILFVFKRVWPFLIYGITLFVMKAIGGKLFKYDSIVIFLSCFGMTIFTFFMISAGKSGGYVRYLMYPMMFAMGFVPYVINAGKSQKKRMSYIFMGVQILMIGFFAWAFKYSSLFREDILLGIPAHSEQLANYINDHLRNEYVLMDSYRTYYTIMNVDDVDHLIISCSPNFDECVSDPVGNHVDYIVVPQIGSYGNMDALNIAWPNLYYGGELWAQEVTDIGEFRVYKVKR